MGNQFQFLKLFLLLLAIPAILLGQDDRRQERKPRNDNPDQRPQPVFKTDVPAHDYDVILCKPTDKSITVSLLSYQPAEASIVYYQNNQHPQLTQIFKLQPGVAINALLPNLEPNSLYHYYILYKRGEQKDFQKSPVYRFYTQRSVASSFSFTITADSHLDENTDPQLYKNTMNEVAADSADFHIDLGDTFMTDKYRNDYTEAYKQYLAQRYYLGLVGASSPIFLAQGNHDGESGARLTNSSDNMTAWANNSRKSLFPMPTPDAFYSGNPNSEPSLTGLPQNYYAWNWGNALFMVLDPFLYSSRRAVDDPWERTLGKAQYEWLEKTLSQSKAKYRFVFIHNLVGGVDQKGKGRGGAEVVPFYEWGGKQPDGKDIFSEKRPGWPMPIHDLLKKYKVTAVFHGHDHLFARQQVDGILYQCVPQPGAFREGNLNFANEYGYNLGTLLSVSGYLRITVENDSYKIDCLSTKNKNILHSVVNKAP